MRILRHLEKYDPNQTVGSLIMKIREDIELQEEKEKAQLDFLKNTFEGGCFVNIEDAFIGEKNEIVLMRVDTVEYQSKDTDWNLVYRVTGSFLYLSKSLSRFEDRQRTYRKNELLAYKEISEDLFNQYLNVYNERNKQMDNLIERIEKIIGQ